MNWFTRIFSCGRISERNTHQKRNSYNAVRDELELVSEITQAGDNEQDRIVPEHNSESVSKISDNYVRILLRKQEGEPLGVQLKRNSTEISSIQRGSALWKFSNEIPSCASICNVNGLVPTPDTIKQLLRDCRGLSTVFIAFSKKVPPDMSLPANAVPLSRRHGSTARMSHSSTSSAAAYSPTPSQLSTMWRRVSEVGSIPTDPAVLTLPPPTGTSPATGGYDIGGVTPIDFGKLSRDSMAMWTRQIAPGRGSVFGTTLPFEHDRSEDDLSNYRHHLTFEEEFSESPSEYKKRKQSRKRASIEDTNPN